MTVTGKKIGRANRRAQGPSDNRKLSLTKPASTGRPRIRDPFMHPMCMVVTSGTTTIAGILPLGRAFHLFDHAGAWLGAFPNTQAAMAAVPRKAGAA